MRLRREFLDNFYTRLEASALNVHKLELGCECDALVD